MDIRVLRYFLAVAKEGGVQAAAASLNVTQPTLSRQLMALEDELGCKLFERGKRPLRLTESGTHLLQRAEEIVQLMSLTESEFLAARAPIVAGEIRIGAGESAGMRYLANAVKSVRKRHPQVSVSIFSGDVGDVSERLKAGKLDFALFVDPVDVRNLEQYHLPYADRWGLLMRRDDPLAGQTENGVTPEQMRELPLLVSVQVLGESNHFLSRWLGANADTLRIVGRYNLIYNASLMVESGIGHALCMDNLIPTSGNSPFVFRPLTPALESSLTLTWRKSVPLSHAAILFLRHLVHSVPSGAGQSGNLST